MKTKNAFTLIELLAVILILGIIALIAIPKVSNIITESRKETLKTTALNVVDAISNNCNNEELSSYDITSSYYISGSTAIPTLELKGELPDEGIANVSNNCDVEMFINKDKYCAIKNFGDDNVQIGQLNNDDSCLMSDGTIKQSPMVTTPSSCYIYNESGVITGYHFEDVNCPGEITIPDKIANTTITSIGEAAFVEDYDYIIYGNSNMIIEDIAENYDYYSANFESDFGMEFTIDWAYPVSNVDSIQKMCYADPESEGIEKPINYELTGSDGFTFCNIEDSDPLYDAIVYNERLTILNLGNAKHLETIGTAAFYGGSLETILFGSIPLQSIGVSAFEDNYIKGNLYLDNLNMLTNIGAGAFSYDYIEGISLPDSLETVGMYAFDCNEINKLDFNNGTKYIGEAAFSTNMLINVTMSDSVISIGPGAFFDNSIETLNLGKSIESIGYFAFMGQKITSLVIPDSVKTIEDGAFMYNKLSYLKLGSSLTNIGAMAFGINNLSTVTIPANVATIGDSAFSKCECEDSTGNSNLTLIQNKTGRSFDWSKIIDEGTTATCSFITGTCGTVNITG